MASPALAQTVQDDEASPNSDIVVTARNQQETLQTVPLSVAAFDRTMVERFDISDLDDVAKRTPNFTFSNNLGVSAGVPVIRGVGAPRTGARASVGLLIDGIDTGNSGGLNVQSFDIERIEVVRGPQSTQFGRGVLAGAVNFISRRPNWDRLEGEATGEVGTYGLYRVEGRLSGPVADGLAVSLAAQQRGHNGFYRSADEGKKTGDSESTAVVAGVRARLGGNGEAFLRLSYNKDHLGQPSWHQVATNTQTGTTASQRWYVGRLQGDPSKLLHNADKDNYAGVNQDAYRAHLHLKYELGSIMLSSNSAYSVVDTLNDTDTDFTNNAPVISGTTLLGTFRQYTTSLTHAFSQELRAQSDNDGFLNWLIGGYYRTEKLKQKEFDLVLKTTPPAEINPQYDWLYRDTKTYGVFGSVMMQFSDRLSFSQELRYSEDRIAEVSTPGGGASAGFSATFRNWLPRSILEFQATPDRMIYASVSKGNKPGGFNNSAGAGFSPVPNEYKFFDEETLWNYELGVKTRWFDRKLTLNASMFYIDWSDIQVSSSIDVNGLPVGLTRNGGKADALGFEADFRFAPNRIIDIYGGVGYSPIRLIDYSDTRVTRAGIKPLHRAQVAGSPDWTGNLGALITLPVSEEGKVFLQTDLNYRSTTYATEANLAETGEKITMDLQAGYRNGPLRVTAFVNNLFNDDAVTSARAFVNPTTYARSFIVQLAPKRQVGARISYRF